MSFFAIGTVVAAGSVAAAGGAAAVVGAGLAGAAAEATAYGAITSYQSSKNAAAVDTATADYNAKYDTAAAEQLDADTLSNITLERQDDAVYLSRQAASYASRKALWERLGACICQIRDADF